MSVAALSTGWVRNDPRMEYDDATHTYRLGERRLISVTQVLGLTGIAQFDSPWFSEAVKARGSALHAAISLDVEECLDEDTVAPEIQGGIEGWRKFLADTHADIEHAEQRLCDPAMGIAGRLDYIVRLPATKDKPTRRLLIDVKRSLYACAAVQLAGYDDMARALYAEPVYFGRAALVLPCDGSYTLHHFTDTTDRATWQSAVQVVNWRRAHGCCD